VVESFIFKISEGNYESPPQDGLGYPDPDASADSLA
jgi:hypothetical protein